MKNSVETNALAIGYGKAALARDIALGAAKGQVLALIGPVPKPLETLCEESGLSVGQILAALTELERAGKIIPLAGRRYQLK